ncbi:alcohol dehydrogenase catalytic domain-containing protein [Halioxenophilus aromaticivorans]|uniref:Alcohol dehydrogenase-like N-terminal domain-containing protein n=1 Tax=Halioxenophilus aromaticivorans TaxID=1306992 RepID=A0AAV3U858_9ALTE
MVESVFAQITVDHQVQLVQQEIGPPAPGEVQVKALYSTISAGTESELIAGHILPLPQPLGYSLCGEITQIGEAVRGFCVGDKVVATTTHAKVQNLDHRMLAKVPSGCPADAAAFFNLAHTHCTEYGVLTLHWASPA